MADDPSKVSRRDMAKLSKQLSRPDVERDSVATGRSAGTSPFAADRPSSMRDLFAGPPPPASQHVSMVDAHRRFSTPSLLGG